ncbi:Protein of unknown function [Bacillus thuringiensis]|uniref:Uncharacterized protein n=1 Tax=Bacillus thuringiensis TaxID=1428 RepID=A0A1C4DDL7_BACTU|nr:Protein of unknown function [Bacillus thuringiensis]
MIWCFVVAVVDAEETILTTVIVDVTVIVMSVVVDKIMTTIVIIVTIEIGKVF